MEETTYGTSLGMGGFHGGFNRPDKEDGRKPDRGDGAGTKEFPDGENPPFPPDLGGKENPDGTGEGESKETSGADSSI